MNSPIPFLPNPYFNNDNMINNMQNTDIKNIENRIYNLEKELYNLKSRITKLETNNDNYTNSYKVNTYNMM